MALWSGLDGLGCCLDALLFWLTYHCPDIACIQETHCKDSSELQNWLSGSIFSGYGDYGSQRSAGVAILFRFSLNITCTRQSSNGDGRFLSLRFSNGTTVSTLYAPNHNPEKARFFSSITNILDPTEDNIITGDFNSVMPPWTVSPTLSYILLMFL